MDEYCLRETMCVYIFLLWPAVYLFYFVKTSYLNTKSLCGKCIGYDASFAPLRPLKRPFWQKSVQVAIGSWVSLWAQFSRPSSPSLPEAGAAGFCPEQEERPVHQERCSALQEVHPSHDGLCVPRLEIRCTKPRSRAAGASIQVSSHCYWCILVHQ